MSIKIGSVILHKNNEIYPIKNKYAVCVHIEENEENIWLFLINSHSRKIYYCTEAIKKENYRFLANDSYVSCNSVFRINIVNDKYKLLGRLNSEDMNKIYDRIKGNKVLNKYEEKEIIESMNKDL